MGISIVISSSIMIIALLAAAFTILNSINDISIIEVLNDNIVLYDDISNTDIKIISIQASDNNNFIIVNVNNNGTTKLWNYRYFDLIVTYDANITNNNVRVTEYLAYSTTLTNGSWTVNSIINDALDPDILNPDEQAVIHAKLSYTIYPNGKLIVSLSTNNGVTYTTGKVI